ncbi:MAG: histidine phosphatase family protein [Roseiarcus sp.]
MAPISYRVVFVRHGETDYNAQGRLQGQRDIPLNARGRAQASAIGRALAKAMPDAIAALEAAEAFIASPLLRTRQTMELARAALGLESQRYALEPALKELTFGEWEGLTWPQVAKRDPAGARARETDKWNFAPPDGESYAMLATRLQPWLESRTADCFVVSHGGVARALMSLIAGVSPSAAENADIWQGRAILFEGGGLRWIG